MAPIPLAKMVPRLADTQTHALPAPKNDCGEGTHARQDTNALLIYNRVFAERQKNKEDDPLHEKDKKHEEPLLLLLAPTWRPLHEM
jgi:hypothetical protein